MNNLVMTNRQAYLAVASNIVSDMTDTRTKILDLAEKLIRQHGYHAVSFRDLADELGIKSASIHYHFRHKEDLGEAVIARYAEAFHEGLGGAKEKTWADALQRFRGLYREALGNDDAQCLCGILAAESFGLPKGMSEAVADFFEQNLVWLAAAMPESVDDKRTEALRIQSEVQGAMIIAISLGDPSILDRVAT